MRVLVEGKTMLITKAISMVLERAKTHFSEATGEIKRIAPDLVKAAQAAEHCHSDVHQLLDIITQGERQKVFQPTAFLDTLEGLHNDTITLQEQIGQYQMMSQIGEKKLLELKKHHGLN